MNVIKVPQNTRRQEDIPLKVRLLLKHCSRKERKNLFIEAFKVSLNSSKLLVSNRNILNELILAVSSNKEEYTIDCSVLEEDGKKILILKRNNVLSDPIVQILPVDELLNVISDVFDIYPRVIVYENIYTILSSKYSLPIINRIHFGSVLKTSIYYESLLQCNIVSIDAKSDTNFNFVLICVDDLTNYTYLRPLSKLNPHEVAVEFIKLFMDIGIPQIIEVQTLVGLFKDTFDYLTTLNLLPMSDMQLEFKKKIQKLSKTELQLMNEIHEWFLETRSKNWVIGIGYIQWMLNNQISTFEGKLLFANSTDLKVSPYQSHFGYKPNLCSIFCEFEYELDGSCTSDEVMCSVCDTLTYRPVCCSNCNGSVHSTCATKTLIENDIMNIIKVICNLCNT